MRNEKFDSHKKQVIRMDAFWAQISMKLHSRCMDFLEMSLNWQTLITQGQRNEMECPIWFEAWD